MARQARRVPLGADTGVAVLVRDPDRPHAYTLLLDGTPQSHVDLDDPAFLVFEYVRRIGHLVDLAAPPGEPIRVLHLGGGALTLPRYVAATRSGSAQAVVEHDAALAASVRAALPWPRSWRLRVRVADAREALAAVPPGRYDLVVTDVFTGGQVPAAVLTAPALSAVAAALAPGGRLALNVADGPGLAYARRVLATARATWPHVAGIIEPGVLRGRRFGNVVVCASAAPLPCAELSRRCAADPSPARVLTGGPLADLVAGCRPLTDTDGPDGPRPPDGVLAWRG